MFVGGGNTFRLLKTLQDAALLEPLQRRARDGLPYLGASAGINIVCPTIRTTNDMPIVEPADFEALALVPFQINPHYLDPDPGSRHMGETREDRIREFLEENDAGRGRPARGGLAARRGRRRADSAAARAPACSAAAAHPRSLRVGASLDPLL